MLLWLGIALALSTLHGCLTGIRHARAAWGDRQWNRTMETVAVRDWRCVTCRRDLKPRVHSCWCCRAEQPKGVP